jgi:hypothetical protein
LRQLALSRLDSKFGMPVQVLHLWAGFYLKCAFRLTEIAFSHRLWNHESQIMPI